MYNNKKRVRFFISLYMPKVLLINDIHVSHNNIPEFHLNWNEALKVCQDHSITEIIVGGDLWQSRSAQTLDTLMAVKQALLNAEKLGICVTLANGNHCKVNQDSIEGYCHVFSEYPDVYVVDDFLSYEISDKVVIYTVAYFPETGKFLDIYKNLIDTIDKTKKNILYIHAGVNGALTHPSEKDLPANMFTSFEKVLIGHYHNRCHIENSNVYYIGASRQHNFGEDEEKGYNIVNEDGSVEFIKNEVNTRFTTLDTPFRKWSHPTIINKLKEYKEEGKCKVRLIINCKQEEASSIDKKLLLESGANKVEVVISDMKVIDNNEPHSLFHKFDKRQIIDTYGQFCEEKGISDVSTGTEYLSKVN